MQFETEHSGKTTDCSGRGSNFPIFSELAVQILAPYLDSNADALPLQHPTESFYAINVTRLIDGVVVYEYIGFLLNCCFNEATKKPNAKKSDGSFFPAYTNFLTLPKHTMGTSFCELV